MPRADEQSSSSPPCAPGTPAGCSWRSWGEDLDPASIAQMQAAARLPIAAAGALMPDAHVGYGLPIGGVLATRGAVVPYAVGVDIACRMKLSVLDLPPRELDDARGVQRLTRALENQTRFGVGASFAKPHQHEVMDRDWSVSPVTQELKTKAWTQLGTSGSGNHFVEFGLLTVSEAGAPHLTLAPGVYLALLSHSGSRGVGAAVCDHYSRLANQLTGAQLAPDQKHLGWLDLRSQPGREYWEAMNLMGHYASANHAIIHRSVASALGAQVIAGVENHHNFAWLERHAVPGPDGTPAEEDVIVHRKGATPAGPGVLGVIPGSMATPGFVVRGTGHAGSLASASHGAGRVMSRGQARRSMRWEEVRAELERAGVTLLSAGIDEAPGVYKDIDAVMAQQRDLVEVVARFDPKLVKMAPGHEKAED
ncbi:MAG TPA: RtcB family protein [Phycisphaerales bacterium]|nr:RtcB family protein [Phycisphaerales bacterium]